MDFRFAVRGLFLLAAFAAPVWSQKTPAPRKNTAAARMALIPAGSFRMGSPDDVGYSDEHPRRKIYIDAYSIDKYDVTAEEYVACVRAGACPAPGTGGACNYGVAARQKHPVNCVAWDAAEAYCAWTGKRLPTEAEWEKAARGGAETKWSFGDDEPTLADYAWYGANSEGGTHPVGMRKSNQYGLYDMAGNVWQWVGDWYEVAYYRSGPARDPQGPPPRQYRVLRGGSWRNQANSSRAAIRYWLDPNLGFNNTGFRCAGPVTPR